MSTDLLRGLPDTIKLAREFALLGNYDNALIYYDGAAAKVAQ